jgi:hypothetical protein
MKPSNSIIAVAAVQFLGSLTALVPPGLYFVASIQSHRLFPTLNRESLAPAVYAVYVGVPICFGLLGIVGSIGLLRLREWARRITLLLSTVPLAGCALLIVLRPSSVFPPDPGQGAIFAIGAGLYFLAFELLLVIMIPIGLWWWILFTRESVLFRFRERYSPSSQAQIRK